MNGHSSHLPWLNYRCKIECLQYFCHSVVPLVFSHIWWYFPHCTFITFGGFFIFFSHIWWYHPHVAQYQHHMWLYFCHIRWLLYFFSHFMGTILTLRSTNITYDCIFVTFGGSFIFSFSHLMAPSSYCVVPTSHVTILCHIWWFPYFFSHILWYHPHIMQYQHHMWPYFCHIGSSIILFLTFYGTSLTLHSTNITCCTFLDPLNTNRLTNYLAKWLT